MKHDLFIQNGLTIPAQELEFSTSRAGGPGGQHVNKTDTRITVRWNVRASIVLTAEQKQRIMEKLGSKITSEGDLMVHNSASRSQQQNKKNALAVLVQEIRSALHIPKKRIPTKISKALKEARLQKKSHRSEIKKMRSKHTFTILFLFLWICNITNAMNEKNTLTTHMTTLPQELQLSVFNTLVDQATSFFTLNDYDESQQKELIRHILIIGEVNRKYHTYINSFAFIRKLFKTLPIEVKYPLASRLLLQNLGHDPYYDYDRVLNHNGDMRGIEYYCFLTFTLCETILPITVMQLYLQTGADPNFYANRGHSCDNLAPAYMDIISSNGAGTKEKLALLLAHGADVNIQLSLSVLLEHNGCRNGCPLYNPTPLDLALYYDNEDAVQEICKRKPKKICLKQAFLSKNPTIKEYILNSAFPFTKEDLNQGLASALATQNHDDITTLLKMGADPDTQLCKTVDRTIDGCLHPEYYKPYKDIVLYPEQYGYVCQLKLSGIPIPDTELIGIVSHFGAYDAAKVEQLKKLRDTAIAMIGLLENNKPNHQ